MTDDNVVLVGVDGSPESLAAVDWAVARAECQGWRVHILCAYSLPSFTTASLDGGYAALDDSAIRSGAQAVIDEAVERVKKSGVAVTSSLETGDPAGVLVDLSEEATLAVVGTRGGGGFAEAARRGSAAHDEIVSVDCGRLTRSTNRAGGIEGGISNGSDVRVRAAFKPISTVPRALRTVDLATGEPAAGLHQRSDVCAVVPGAVIAQAMTALVLADLLLDKTGGDSVDEARRNLRSYLDRIAERTQWRTER